MTVHGEEDRVHHVGAGGSIAHLRDGSERHVEDEEDVEVRGSLRVRLRFEGVKPSSGDSGEPGLGARHLGQRVGGDEVVRRVGGRYRPSQQDGELAVGDARNVGVEVVAQGRVDRRGRGPFDLEGGAQRRVGDVASHVDRPGSCLGFPRCALCVPVTERVAVEGNRHAHRFSGADLDLGKALEFAGGTEHAAGGAHVELDDLGTVTRGGVGEREGRPILVHDEVGIFEARVGQAVSEWEGNVDARGGEIAVSDERAFAVVRERSGCRVPCGGRVVLVGVGVCFGQAPRRIDDTGEDVEHRAGASLSGQVTVDERGHGRCPRHLDAGAAGQDDDGARIRCDDGLDKPILALGQAHVGAVQALGFGQLVETHVDKRHVGALGEGHGLGDEIVARTTVTLVSARVTGEDEASGGLSPGFEQLARRFDASGIDLGGSRSLEARSVCKIADEGDARAGVQGQQIVVVTQKRDRLGGNARGQLVVRPRLVGPGGGQPGAGRRDVENFLGARIDVGRIQFPDLDGRDDLAGTRQAGGGHLETAAGARCLDGTVRTAPVGDDHAVETPLGAQDVGQQVLVFVRVGAVNEVVGAHDRPRLSRSADDLEAGQVDFAHRALVHDGIRGHAAQFLRVDGEVLGAGSGTRGLDSFDEAGGHASSKDRVLGKVLKVASTQRRALDVEARAEQNVHTKASGLHTQCLAHLTRQVGIPRCSNSGGRREAGRLLGLRDAQVISIPELAANTVGTVAHDEGGNARRRDRARVPGTRSREKRRRLQEGELAGVRQCCVFHRRELPFVLHRGCRRWFQCGPPPHDLTDRAHDLSFAGRVLHERGCFCTGIE